MRTFGRYRLRKQIGSGAMGTVWEGFDPQLERPLAIKTMRLPEDTDPEQRRKFETRFRHEAKLLARLSHPNIVSIFDAGQEGPDYFLVMELLRGQGLWEAMYEDDRFSPVERLFAVLKPLAAALTYAHGEQVIHRDIKPENIFLVDGQTPKLIDFGIARLPESTLTTAGSVLGTPQYMSPEQFRTDGVITAQVDVYALGVLAFQMLTEDLPFGDSNLSVVITQVMFQSRESLRPQLAAYSKATQDCVLKAMAIEGEDRYASATSFVRELEAVFEKAPRDPGNAPPKKGVPASVLSRIPI